MSSERALKIAESLLQIKAVKLSPAQPFTWTSGWKSPIYCDNRQTLSHPAIRRMICEGFCEVIRREFSGVDGIAGVATAGIPHGALVAEALGLPFIYVRAEAKKHGLNNKIEGDVKAAGRYAVIEDLVSTGGSSLAAAQAVREAGAGVECLLSIFSYGFPKAELAFSEAAIPFRSLTGLEALLQKAVEIAYIQPADLDHVRRWQQDPEHWQAQELTS